MRMLRQMCGKTFAGQNQKRNLHGIALIEDMMRENRLRWFRHVYRRFVNELIRSDTRRPKLTLEAAIRKDIGFLDITEHDALERTQWRQQILVADPN